MAVPLGEAARAAVRELVDTVLAGPAGAEAARLRWVATESLHLTLRFLGATPAQRVPDVTEAVAQAAREISPFVARLAGAGGFPTTARPRVAWLGIGDGAAELTGLARGIGDQLVARGWPPDERAFRAHLTLARADGVAGAGRAVAALAAAAGTLDASWPVDDVVVYESVPGHGPVRYRALASVPLCAATLPDGVPLR